VIPDGGPPVRKARPGQPPAPDCVAVPDPAPVPVAGVAEVSDGVGVGLADDESDGVGDGVVVVGVVVGATGGVGGGVHVFFGAGDPVGAAGLVAVPLTPEHVGVGVGVELFVGVDVLAGDVDGRSGPWPVPLGTTPTGFPGELGFELVLEPAENVAMTPWRSCGMAMIAMIATITAPAVANTGRIHPLAGADRRQLSGSRNCRQAAELVSHRQPSGRARRRMPSGMVSRGQPSGGRRRRSASAPASRCQPCDSHSHSGRSLSTRASWLKARDSRCRQPSTNAGVRQPPGGANRSSTANLSQAASQPRPSCAGARAVRRRIRSSPSPDGTTVSAAACNARRRRSP